MVKLTSIITKSTAAYHWKRTVIMYKSVSYVVLTHAHAHIRRSSRVGQGSGPSTGRVRFGHKILRLGWVWLGRVQCQKL